MPKWLLGAVWVEFRLAAGKVNASKVTAIGVLSLVGILYLMM